MPEDKGIVVDTGLVRELAELLDANNLTEIEVQDGERVIRVVRAAAPVTMTAAAPNYAPAPPAGGWPAPPQAAAAPAAPASSAGDDLRNHPGVVKSPIVGTAYLTPEPGASAFVAEGATVKVGDTLLIIEAMKVMNPILAPRAGTVRSIMVKSEQPVEYDQPLLIIE
ncbi:acetyl-CoA carboxylase biotin carboxyl carrier protein [Sandarakinorhabdus sp.]|uniref:acetyl-CoA carboxylase biotin carboxyl carrier protein n=1 Tax=Sandarakinorhabdus sp. TaxID=1916663 RepID=UPI003F7048EA